MSLTAPPDGDEEARALRRLSGVTRKGRGRQRRRWAVPIVAAVGVVAVAAGLSATWRRGATRIVRVTSPAFPLVGASAVPPGAVAWADLPPGPFNLASPPPTTLPSASSPPCRASQLTIVESGGNGAGGHLGHGYTFTNTSAVTCLLGGYPKVVAREPGHPDVVATDGTFFGNGGPPGDLAPYASSTLIIETDRYCAASPGGGGVDVYHQVTVTLPGGGDLVVSDASLDVVCGLRVAAFAWPVPNPPAPLDPIAALHVTLDAPHSLRPGTTAVYAVVLANPTDAVVALDPCPNFVETLDGTIAKDLHQLNCRAARPIPGHGQEAFVMHLVVPDDTAAGPTVLHWNFFAPGEDHASAPVEVVAGAGG